MKMRFFLFLIPAALLSFQESETCLKEVRAVFDKLNDASNLVKHVSYMNYTVTSVAAEKDNDGKNIVSSGSFEMISSSKENRIYSKEMVVLKGQENTFTVLPGRKMIYISDAVIGKKDENLYDKLKILQDTIFHNA